MKNSADDRLYSTRFSELKYRQLAQGLWRFVAVDDGMAVVGAYYKTERELLADAERYAGFYGCAGALPDAAEMLSGAKQTFVVLVQKPCSPRANPANHTMTLVVVAGNEDEATVKVRAWLVDHHRADHKVQAIRLVDDVEVIKA